MRALTPQAGGFLAAFGADKLSSSHPELGGVAQATRVFAHALSHIMPPDKVSRCSLLRD